MFELLKDMHEFDSNQTNKTNVFNFVNYWLIKASLTQSKYYLIGMVQLSSL